MLINALSLSRFCQLVLLVLSLSCGPQTANQAEWSPQVVKINKHKQVFCVPLCPSCVCGRVALFPLLSGLSRDLLTPGYSAHLALALSAHLNSHSLAELRADQVLAFARLCDPPNPPTYPHIPLCIQVWRMCTSVNGGSRGGC